MKIRYKIVEMLDAENETIKEIPQELKKEFSLDVLKVGFQGVLSSKNSGFYRTSLVKKIAIFNNVIKITTENTQYYLQPFSVEVS